MSVRLTSSATSSATLAPMPTAWSIAIGKKSMPRKQHTSVPPLTRMVWPAKRSIVSTAAKSGRPRPISSE